MRTEATNLSAHPLRSAFVVTIAGLLIAGTVTVGSARATGPGGATAQAARVALSAGANPLGLALGGLTLAAATPVESAPASPGTASSTTGLTADAAAAAVATGTVTASATRTTDGTASTSQISNATVSAFGVTVLSTGDITATTSCPAGGTPTATTQAVGVTVGGSSIDAAVGGTGSVGVTVAGVNAAAVNVAISSPHSTTADSATATGLLATLTLTGTVPILGTAVTVPLGTVTLAATTCATPDASAGTNPAAAPTLTAISPGSGPTAGGQTVTITGTGFVPGTTVDFGGSPASAVNVVSPTSLTAVTPPSDTAGSTLVAVHTPAGTSGTLAYVYVAPHIVRIDPDQGPTAGGQSITVTGTGFDPGASLTLDGDQATNVVVNDAGTAITATTPAHAAGPVDVVVVQRGADAVLPAGYTYVPPGAPIIGGIDPAAGPTDGGQTVTITGSGFAPGDTVDFGGSAATEVEVTSPTTVTATTPRHVAGAIAVTVRNADGASGARLYTYVLGEKFARTSAGPVANAAVEGSGATAQLPFTGQNTLVFVALATFLLAAGAWASTVGGRTVLARRRR